MKKILSVIAVNILLLCIFLSILEFALYKHHKRNYPEIGYIIKKLSYDDIFTIYKKRPVEGTQYNSRPIVLTGCSYAYGQGLDSKQTLGHKLSQFTKRPVYNYSLPGKGLQHNLYVLSHNMTDPELKNPEVVLYIFMYDQIRRLYSTVCLHDFSGYPAYKVTGDDTVELKHNFYPVYKQFYVYYFFNNIYRIYFDSNNLKEHSRLVNAYFKSINKEVKRLWPNARFAVLMYDDGGNNYGLDLKPTQEAGIQIIHTDELSDIILSSDEYHLAKNDFHPNSKAWDILIPALAKKLGVNQSSLKSKKKSSK